MISSDKFKFFATKSIQLIDEIQDKKTAIKMFEEFLKIMEIPSHIVKSNILLVKEKELSSINTYLKHNVEIGVSKDFAHEICLCHSSCSSYSSQFLKVLEKLP